MKQISLILFGSVAWLVCAVVLPMNQGPDGEGFTAKVANFVISQAYAEDDDEAKSDDEAKDDDKDKSKDKDEDKSKDTSVSYDFGDATLVCVDKNLVLTALSLGSSDDDEAKSDDDKSKDDEAKSDDDGSKDDEAKSDDDKSKDDEAKPDDDESKDDEAKSDDDKSKDDEAKDSSTDIASFVENLSGCTAIVVVDSVSGKIAGVWVPESAVVQAPDGTTTLTTDVLTSYFTQVQAASETSGGASATSAGGAGSGTPDSSMESYREIRGE